MFCFYCGYMGHNKEQCSNLVSPSHGIIEITRLSFWMKDNQSDKQQIPQKGRRFKNNPYYKPNISLYSATPTTMLEKMIDLTLG